MYLTPNGININKYSQPIPNPSLSILASFKPTAKHIKQANNNNRKLRTF